MKQRTAYLEYLLTESVIWRIEMLQMILQDLETKHEIDSFPRNSVEAEGVIFCVAADKFNFGFNSVSIPKIILAQANRCKKFHPNYEVLIRQNTNNISKALKQKVV